MKDRQLAIKINEYSKRIRFEAKIEFVALKDSRKETEGQRILEFMGNHRKSRFLALSEDGCTCTSRQFAGKLNDKAGDFTFIIGGPTGLSEEVKEKADELISLSQMTMTHEMAQFFLVEQLFRSLAINNKRSYHKD